MGCRILYDPVEQAACLYDSVTGTAFGPVFHADGRLFADDRAERFVQSLEVDPRTMFPEALKHAYEKFMDEEEKAA